MDLNAICFGSIPNSLDDFDVDFDNESKLRNVRLNIKYISDICNYNLI